MPVPLPVYKKEFIFVKGDCSKILNDVIHALLLPAQLRDLEMSKTIKTEIQGRLLHTLSAEFNEWNIAVTTVINQTDTHCPSPDLSRQTVTVLRYRTLTKEYCTSLTWRP